MIGIKVENNFWEKALLDLLKNRSEVWDFDKHYQVVITDLSGQKLKSFQQKEKASLILLGKVTNSSQNQLQIPFKKDDLEKLLASLSCPYENSFFLWDPIHLRLKDKKNKKEFCLTEKEANIINFLASCPQKTATKEELLKNAWGYTTDAETHTVESTLYTLRQKLGKFADKLIISTKTGYRLI